MRPAEPEGRLIRRVVFDTSTLVSAALRRGSIPDQALAVAMRFCDLCASQQTLDELRQVLTREKFDHYLPLSARESFVRVVEDAVNVYVVRQSEATSVVPPCRDVKDNKFLELALVAEANAIISSDEDLLVLNPWNEIPVVPSIKFLDAMREEI